MKPFFVYMLRCRNGSCYVGSTDDLETRVNQHQHGTYDGHTCRLRPVHLVWSTEASTRDEALVLEFRVKRWSRAKKEALIEGDWEALRRAARGPNRQHPSTAGAPLDSGRTGCGLRSGRADVGSPSASRRRSRLDG